MDAETLCTCCDVPMYSCGAAVEKRRRQDERAVRQRALQEPGVVAAKWPGTCTCGTSYEVGAPIRKTPDGWMNVLCCPDEQADATLRPPMGDCAVMPYPETRTYWLEPTDRISVGLRRYHHSGGMNFTCEGGYHSALVITGEEPAEFSDVEEFDRRTLAMRPVASHDDPNWPKRCDCGYEFTEDDNWQSWQELLYERSDTGERVTLRSPSRDDDDGPPGAPPGACWDAWWMPPAWRGPDGIALMVRCPNGRDWHVDGEASNCTRPGDKLHRCWVRHGDPRECHVTVDKAGDTCAAGAGSIVAGDYHGFLRDGVLTAG